MPNKTPLAQTTTQTISTTKLAIATAILIGAGILAYAAVPLTRSSSNCIESVTLEKQCGKTGYTNAVFTCADGTKAVHSEKSCLTAKQWDSYGATLCKSRCKDPQTAKKSLNSFNAIGTEEVPTDAIVFADVNLENVIRGKINKSSGYILKSEVDSISELQLDDKGIGNLQGLEEFQSLGILNLKNNQIHNITPLLNLTGLVWLNLDNNQITSLGGLNQLSRLEELSARQNQLTRIDIGPITGLKRLYLSNNQINDLSGLITSLNLFAFPMLEEIYLDNNQISSLSPFSGVQTIKKLNVANNPVSDISPLDSSLPMTFIDLTNDPINNIERMRYWNSLQRVLIGGTGLDGSEDCTMIDTLRSRGVTVIADSRINNVLCET